MNIKTVECYSTFLDAKIRKTNDSSARTLSFIKQLQRMQKTTRREQDDRRSFTV